MRVLDSGRTINAVVTTCGVGPTADSVALDNDVVSGLLTEALLVHSACVTVAQGIRSCCVFIIVPKASFNCIKQIQHCKFK